MTGAYNDTFTASGNGKITLLSFSTTGSSYSGSAGNYPVAGSFYVTNNTTGVSQGYSTSDSGSYTFSNTSVSFSSGDSITITAYVYNHSGSGNTTVKYQFE